MMFDRDDEDCRERVLRALGGRSITPDQPATAERIADLTGIDAARVSRILSRLAQRGLARRIARGAYVAAPPGPSPRMDLRMRQITARKAFHRLSAELDALVSCASALLVEDETHLEDLRRFRNALERVRGGGGACCPVPYEFPGTDPLEAAIGRAMDDGFTRKAALDDAGVSESTIDKRRERRGLIDGWDTEPTECSKCRRRAYQNDGDYTYLVGALCVDCYLHETIEKPIKPPVRSPLYGPDVD